MKAFVATMGAAMALLGALGAWTTAAKMMNQADDLSVVKGVLIMAGLLGLAAAGVYTTVKAAFRPAAPAGKDVGDKKDCG